MPSTVLVSFSLLALVVTARPIVPLDSKFEYPSTSDVQSAVQAIFESKTRDLPDQLEIPTNDFDIRLLTTEEQQAYLAQLDGSSIRALVPLDENSPLSPEAKSLIDMLGSSERMDDVEGASRPLETLLSPLVQQLDLTTETGVSTSNAPTSQPAGASAQASIHSEPIILAVSCLVALLSLACVGGFLYAIYYVRNYVLSSRVAWDLLPELEKQQRLGRYSRELTYSHDEKLPLSGNDTQGNPSSFIERVSKFAEGKGSDSETEDDYQDALSNSTTPTITPRVLHIALPPALEIITPSLVPLPLSPLLRPNSLEDEIPEFGDPTTTPRPGAVANVGNQMPARHNTVLDYAFALQLRPGVGFGADPAWLVQFLMAIFGWVAILVGGPRDLQQRRIVGVL